MTLAQLLASIARHSPFLHADQAAGLAPCPSEQAVRVIASRMQARLPGAAS